MFLAVGSRLLPAPQSSAFSYRRQRDWWQKFRRPDENPTTQAGLTNLCDTPRPTSAHLAASSGKMAELHALLAY